jgi:class 3 adenylate cyclase/tetratricopeptide (TPR) repeat protein
MGWQCGSCGADNAEGTRFCGQCGVPASRPANGVGPEAEAVTTPGPELDPSEALRSFVTGQVADRLVEAGGQLAEERRLVTALFADLSGFTPLSERLDPEELLEVIDPIITALTDVVGRFEGFVEKFAGDALLAMFGAPVSHEDDAARAMLVAIEMHRELAHLCQQLGPDAAGLTLHIGVNSGHGIARMIGSQVRLDYGVLGDSVILAQRLESAAPAGETYVGETTHRLVRDRFDFEPVEPLTLKGKSEPVLAWRLVGERAASEQSTLAVRHGTPLIGREEEIGAVRAVLDTLMAGTGGVVTILGEPGVGKSRLTDEARRAAAANGIRWLEARCLSYGSGLAYWPFLDLLRRVAGIRVEDPLDQAAERLHGALSASAPESLPYFARLIGLPSDQGDPQPQLEPEAFRRGLHNAFARWLRALSAAKPTVVALEDAHWADASTLDLVLELARVLREDRVVLYLTGRPGVSRLVEEVAASDAHIALSLHLKPLDAHGVVALTEHLLGGMPPPGLLTVLFERGAGNPFFVEETVQSLLESRALIHIDGRWDLRPGWEESEVPPTIEGVLAARIDALPSGAVRLLQVASVIGRRVRIPLLRAVASDLADVDTSIGQLLASRFLDEGADRLEEAVVFHHALMQEVAYGRLLRRRRRELHLRTAEAAERLYGAGDDVIDLLARHLYLGEAGSRAIDYLLRAGERARSLFANDEAIVHFGHALEFVRGDPTLGDRLSELLLTLADLHELRGAYDDARNLFEEARDLTGEVRAWRGIAASLRSRGAYAEALEILNRAFAAPELSGSDLRPLWLERGWSLSAGGSLPDAVAAYRAGLQRDGAAADVTTARLLVELGRAEATAGNFRPAAEHAEQARRILEEHGDLRLLVTALRVLGGVQDDLQEYGEAERTLRQALAIAERVGKAEEIGHSLVNLAVVQRNLGDLDAAIKSLERAIEEYERIGHASGRTIGYANLGEAQVRAGNLEEAERLSLRAGELARSIGHGILHGQSLENLAEIRMKQERYAEALEFAQQAAVLFGDGGVAHIAAECWQLAAEAAQKMGDAERAKELAARASSLPGSEA